MKSVKSKSAITWVVTDKISVTFYELEYTKAYAVSVFPGDTLVRFDGWRENKFKEFCHVIPGVLTCKKNEVTYVNDGTQIWRVTRDGVKLENQHEKLCKYFMDNGVLFEFDGQSTYLLLKNKAEPLTHFSIDWERMISCGSLKVIHSFGNRKLAKMVSKTNLPISASYEKELLEVCK